MSIKIAIAGAGGRMGKRLLALASEDKDLVLTNAIENPSYPLVLNPKDRIVEELPANIRDILWTSNLEKGVDVLIDFSTPEATIKNLKLALEYNTALVIGTTGLNLEQNNIVKEASKKIPVLQASNFSLGVNLLFSLATEVAKALGEDYDIEIIEAHHNQKVDAPSGTALSIAEAIATAIGRDINKDLVYGRSGRPGARSKKEIGMHSLRMGSVVGDHSVFFANQAERIELSHKAENRDVFALGALKTAKWLAKKPAGYYKMHDILFK